MSITGARALDPVRYLEEVSADLVGLLRSGIDLGVDPSDERPVEEYLLERAALARARSERQIVDAVATARSKNVPWTRIGELLGTSAQAAQQRYGNVITTS